MRITIERLRTGVLVLTVLLVIAVVGFLGFARYRGRKILRDLPHQLGMQIQQSADGITYSQSHGGHTLFTLHASKMIQYKEKGRATLHDVSILLYGPDGKRADRISGQDFDYDPSSGIALAQGAVQIDLQNPNKQPGAEQSFAAGTDGTGTPGSIRVKTSGLSFNQKTGLATTSEAVEFQFPQATGKATGASYDSQKGVLMLDHAVEIDSTDNDGNALVVHAGSAQIVRDSHQGFFEQIACKYRGDQMSADHATLLFRDDGSARQINADGKIHLQTDTGTVVDSKTGVMEMDARSQPLQAHLSGGVSFHSYDPERKVNGNAGEALITFAGKGAPRHATLSNLVSLVDLENGLPGDSGGTATRQVQSEQLGMDFTTDQAQHTVLKTALAQGNAKVALRTNPTRGAKQDTAIAADHLLAEFTGTSAITMLTGSGHTRLTDVAANGVTQTSTGDNLVINFVQVGRSPAGRSGREARVQSSKAAASIGGPDTDSSHAGLSIAIASAVQQGNVAMEQLAAASTAPATAPAAALGAVAFRATAQKATYFGANQILHLEGSPHVSDGELDLTSTTLDYSRASGDAVANGSVQATYLHPGGGAAGAKDQTSRDGGNANNKAANDQSQARGLLPGPDPAHIVAARATLVRASGDAIFRGQARLWQGTNSISAPVIELSQTHQTLKAHGDTDSAPAAVSAAFLTSSSPTPAVGSPAPSGSSGFKRQPGLVRIRSRQMLYSDGERKASFRGGAVADDGAETVRSDEADVFLVPVPIVATAPTALTVPTVQGQKASNPAGSLVDHILASGHVVLQQAGRKGTGDKLVYGAQDGNFVLTGTAAAHPTLSDVQHGIVTGDSLIFNSRDDSVTVSGGSSGTVTRTRSPR